jgi:hypothetical protein
MFGNETYSVRSLGEAPLKSFTVFRQAGQGSRSSLSGLLVDLSSSAGGLLVLSKSSEVSILTNFMDDVRFEVFTAVTMKTALFMGNVKSSRIK